METGYGFGCRGRVERAARQRHFRFVMQYAHVTGDFQAGQELGVT